MNAHTPITASPTLTADEAHVRLAAASGCSAATFAGIFGTAHDLTVYHGWRLAMADGVWTASKGDRTLRAPTLGGIYAAVDKRRRAVRAVEPEPTAHARSTWGMVK